MKTLNEIKTNLDLFSSRYGLDTSNVSQGSEAWFKIKLGVVSASMASDVVAKRDSKTRLTYMANLVSQICTGEIEEIHSKYLEWGKNNEAPARSTYEFESDLKIEQVPFVFKDDSFREGCSPDGIISQNKRGVEIKCPYNATNYILFLCEDKIKSDYLWQVQFSMRALNCETYDFCQYHPNMKRKPIKIMTIEKDDKMQATLNDAVPQFLIDMNDMLKKTGLEFGSQWLNK